MYFAVMLYKILMHLLYLEVYFVNLAFQLQNVFDSVFGCGYTFSLALYLGFFCSPGAPKNYFTVIG